MNQLASWQVPANVLTRWEKAHGHSSVRDWQAAAPRLADEWARTWGVEVETVLPGGSLSYALAGTRADGRAVVLKLLAPWSHAAAASEARALAGWKGCGVVELLEHSPNGRVLLLRRVRPGLPFAPSGVDSADCARVASTLAALGSAPEVADLPDLQTAVRGRFARARVSGREGAPVTAVQLDAAQSRAVELAASASMRGPVHGDAQDKNLLVDEGGDLVAIDPEPAIGDPHFDAALWALTHRPGEGVRERCAELARLLSFDEGRLWSWCLALAVAEVALDVPERARAQRRLLQRAGLMDD